MKVLNLWQITPTVRHFTIFTDISVKNDYTIEKTLIAGDFFPKEAFKLVEFQAIINSHQMTILFTRN